jgi:hypothetical protein
MEVSPTEPTAVKKWRCKNKNKSKCFIFMCVYRAEEIATQQFNAAKKEQTVVEQNKGSFFKRKRLQNHRRSKSLGKVRSPPHPPHTAMKIPFMNSFSGNCAASVLIFTFMRAVSDLYIHRIGPHISCSE